MRFLVRLPLKISSPFQPFRQERASPDCQASFPRSRCRYTLAAQTPWARDTATENHRIDYNKRCQPACVKMREKQHNLSISNSQSSVVNPYIWQMDLDPIPDPAIFVSDLKAFAYYFLNTWTYIYIIHFSRIKSHKEITKQWKSCFAYYFCLMMEASGSGTGKPTKSHGSYGSGSTTLSQWEPRVIRLNRKTAFVLKQSTSIQVEQRGGKICNF